MNNIPIQFRKRIDISYELIRISKDKEISKHFRGFFKRKTMRTNLFMLE